MNKFLLAIKSWFTFPSGKKASTIKPPVIALIPPSRSVKPFKAKHYQKLISKLTQQMHHNERKRRSAC